MRQSATWKLLAFMLILLLNLAGRVGYAEEKADDLEHKVKAAFVYRLIKFVTWPETHTNVKLCELGKSDITPFLRSADGLQLGRQTISYSTISNTESFSQCHIVYIDNDSDIKIGKVSAAPGVLLIGDDEAFAQNAGMVALILYERKINIEVNTTRTNEAGLKLSANLLEIARKVYQ